MKTSAGILLYRLVPQLELLLGHPGGPFWAKRHEGAWSVIKGEIEEGEDPESAARREFEEETGISAPPTLTSIGSIRQKSGKVVVAFAAELDVDADGLRSNHIEIEWPPKSGRFVDIPEIDRFAWFADDEARIVLNPAQIDLVSRVVSLVEDLREGA